jgi:hypothetical protein
LIVIDGRETRRENREGSVRRRREGELAWCRT